MVSRELYRRLAASFPTGVTVVTALGASKAPNGLTTQSFVGLSAEPALMMVAIDKSSRTLPSVLASRAFVVNFLRDGAEGVAHMFASKAEDKFRGLAWEPSPATGAPVLTGSIVAYAECALADAHEAGDHVVAIGRVLGGETFEGTPLMYYRRTYAAWPRTRGAT